MVMKSISYNLAMYDHQNKTYKLTNLPSFGVATPGVFILSAMFARKIHCIRSGSYSVISAVKPDFWQHY